MLSKTMRVLFNHARYGFVGIIGAMLVAAGCTDDPQSQSSTSSSGGKGGEAGAAGAGGAGGSGGSVPPQIEWTEFQESPDTKKIFVSSSDGNDMNDGSAPDKAVKTIAKGVSLLRDGMPDWMLLKRGNVWLESLGQWSKSGRSDTERMVITTYGTEVTRPILKTGAKAGLVTSSGSLNHLAFVGLHLYAHTRDPDTSDFMSANGGPGIQWLATSDDLLFEDLLVQYYAISNIFLKANMTNVRVRRSILVDAYDTSGNAQGLYVENVIGLLVEENLFDHNGWNTHAALLGLAPPTVHNHNLYVQTKCADVTIRNNLSTRAASHGIQARAGGTVTGNLVLDNPVGISFGLAADEWDPKPGGVTGTVAANVVRDAGDINAANPRGIALQLGNIQSATVDDNILAHDVSAMNTSSIAIDIQRKTNPMVADEKVKNLTIQNNIIYDWRGGIRFSTSALEAIKIQNNDVQAPVRPSELVNYTGTSFSMATSYAGNRWFSTLNPEAWFVIGATNQSFQQWTTASGEQGASNTMVTYTAPDRSLLDYHQTLGQPATLIAYIMEARKQSQKNWRPEYMAKAPVGYIRQGFGKK